MNGQYRQTTMPQGSLADPRGPYKLVPPEEHSLRSDSVLYANFYPHSTTTVERESTITVETAKNGAAQRSLPTDWLSLVNVAGQTRIWEERPQIIAFFDQLSVLRPLAHTEPITPSQIVLSRDRSSSGVQGQGGVSAFPGRLQRSGGGSCLRLPHSNRNADQENFKKYLKRVDYPLSDLREIPNFLRKKKMVDCLSELMVPLDRALWTVKVFVRVQSQQTAKSWHDNSSAGISGAQAEFGSDLIESIRQKVNDATSSQFEQFLYLYRLIQHCYFGELVEMPVLYQGFIRFVSQNYKTSKKNNMPGNEDQAQKLFVWAVLFSSFAQDFVSACAPPDLPDLEKQLRNIVTCIQKFAPPAICRVYREAIHECTKMYAQHELPRTLAQQQPTFTYVTATLDALHNVEHNDIDKVAETFLPFIAHIKTGLNTNNCRQSDDNSNDDDARETFVFAMCEWAVTDFRLQFPYRSCVVLTLLKRLVKLHVGKFIPNKTSHHKQISPAEKERREARFREVCHEHRFMFQQQLMFFLQEYVPGTQSETRAVESLFATLIHGGVFSYSMYSQHLIAHGLLQPWSSHPNARVIYHRKRLESLPTTSAPRHCSTPKDVCAHKAEKNQRTALLASFGCMDSQPVLTKRDIVSCVEKLQGVKGHPGNVFSPDVAQFLEVFASDKCSTYDKFRLCNWACSRCLTTTCVCNIVRPSQMCTMTTNVSDGAINCDGMTDSDYWGSGDDSDRDGDDMDVCKEKEIDEVLRACCCNPTPSTFRFLAELCSAAHTPLTLVELLLRALRHKTLCKSPELLGEVLLIVRSHFIIFVRLGCLGKLLSALAEFRFEGNISGGDGFKSRALSAVMRTTFYQLNQKYGHSSEVKRAFKSNDSIYTTWKSAAGTLFESLSSRDTEPVVRDVAKTIAERKQLPSDALVRDVLQAVSKTASQLPLLCHEILSIIPDDGDEDDETSTACYSFVMKLCTFQSSIVSLLLMRESILEASTHFFPLTRGRLLFLCRFSPTIVPQHDLISRTIVPSLSYLTKNTVPEKAEDDVDAHIGAFMKLAAGSMPWDAYLDVFIALAPYFKTDFVPSSPQPSSPMAKSPTPSNSETPLSGSTCRKFRDKNGNFSGSVGQLLQSTLVCCMMCSHPDKFQDAFFCAHVGPKNICEIMRAPLSKIFGIANFVVPPAVLTDACVSSVFRDPEHMKWCAPFAAVSLSFMSKPEHIPPFLIYRFSMLLRDSLLPKNTSGQERNFFAAEMNNSGNIEGAVDSFCSDDNSGPSSAPVVLEIIGQIMRNLKEASHEALIRTFIHILDMYTEHQSKLNSQLPSLGVMVRSATRKYLHNAEPSYAKIIGDEPERQMSDEERAEETLVFGDALANMISDSLPQHVAQPDVISKILMPLLEKIRHCMRIMSDISPQDASVIQPATACNNGEDTTMTDSAVAEEPSGTAVDKPVLCVIQAHILALVEIFRHAFLCLYQPLIRNHMHDTINTLFTLLSSRAVQADHAEPLRAVSELLRTLISASNTNEAKTIVSTVHLSLHQLNVPPMYIEEIRRAFVRAHVFAAEPPQHRAVFEVAEAALAHAPNGLRAVCPGDTLRAWNIIPESMETRDFFDCRVKRGQLTYGPHAVVKPPDYWMVWKNLPPEVKSQEMKDIAQNMKLFDQVAPQSNHQHIRPGM